MPTTTNFAMELPVVGGDVDDWGDKLNANLNIIDKFLVPVGCILMWSGSVASIPATWAICDGTSGTPDLRNRFIVGAGDTYAVAAVGGAATVALSEAELPAHDHAAGTLSAASDGAHTHTGVTDTEGTHTHTVSGIFNTRVGAGSGGGGLFTANGEGGGTSLPATQPNTGADGSHSHDLTIDSGGAHTHTVSGSTAETGSGTAHENRPPYYALAYIMKLAA